MNAASTLSRLGQLLALAVSLVATPVFGQTITQSQSFGPSGPGSTPFSFNSFNSSLGTLTGVTLELSGITASGTATIYNTSNSPPPFGPGGSGYNEDLTGGFSNTYTATSSTSGSDVVTVGLTSNTQTQLAVAAGGSFTTGTLTGTQSPNPQDFAAGDIANYIGSGTATITITLAASTTVNASGNAGSSTVYVAGSAAALASGAVNLIYTYTPAVPEPSKTAAIMIGFALCILVGRNYLKGRDRRLA